MPGTSAPRMTDAEWVERAVAAAGPCPDDVLDRIAVILREHRQERARRGRAKTTNTT